MKTILQEFEKFDIQNHQYFFEKALEWAKKNENNRLSLDIVDHLRSCADIAVTKMSDNVSLEHRKDFLSSYNLDMLCNFQKTLYCDTHADVLFINNKEVTSLIGEEYNNISANALEFAMYLKPLRWNPPETFKIVPIISSSSVPFKFLPSFDLYDYIPSIAFIFQDKSNTTADHLKTLFLSTFITKYASKLLPRYNLGSFYLYDRKEPTWVFYLYGQGAIFGGWLEILKSFFASLLELIKSAQPKELMECKQILFERLKMKAMPTASELQRAWGKIIMQNYILEDIHEAIVQIPSLDQQVLEDVVSNIQKNLV